MKKEHFLKLAEKLGLSEETIELLTAEEIGETQIDTLINTATRENKTKWQTFLENDPTFTGRFTSGGHSSGKAKAYIERKRKTAEILGIEIDESNIDFTDNARFDMIVRNKIDEMKKPAKKSTADFEAEKEALKKALSTEIESKYSSIQSEKEQKYIGQINEMKRGYNLDRMLIKSFHGKKIKGDLDIDDAILLAKIKLEKSFKINYNEDNQIAEFLDLGGNPILNESGDKRLSVSENMAKILNNYIAPDEPETQGESGEIEKNRKKEFGSEKDETTAKNLEMMKRNRREINAE